MFKSWISVESVAMFAVSTFLFIFLVSCVFCALCSIRNVCCFYKVEKTEKKPTHDIKTLTTFLTSSHSRKLEVIIEAQEEENSSIA